MAKTVMCSECGSPYGEDEHHVCPEKTNPPRKPVDDAESAGEQFIEALSHAAPDSADTIYIFQPLDIICGDCGKSRSRKASDGSVTCERCDGASWITAAEWGAIIKAARERRERRERRGLTFSGREAFERYAYDLLGEIPLHAARKARFMMSKPDLDALIEPGHVLMVWGQPVVPSNRTPHGEIWMKWDEDGQTRIIRRRYLFEPE